MGVSLLGQLITFQVQVDHDPNPDNPSYVSVATRTNDTIQKIASRFGQPGHARAIADLNDVRSTHQVINHSPHRQGDLTKVKMPGHDRPGQVLSVLAGEQPPTITGGYAKFDTIDRYARTGITQFKGYDPLELTIPVMFEAYAAANAGPDLTQVSQGRMGIGGALGGTINSPSAFQTASDPGNQIESAIRLLERMAGRGAFSGAGIGPPPVIRATTTGKDGDPVGLIPSSYQWSASNSGPLWRIGGLTWSEGAIRDSNGNRIRAGATVVLREHTHSSLVSQSAAQRAKAS